MMDRPGRTIQVLIRTLRIRRAWEAGISGCVNEGTFMTFQRLKGRIQIMFSNGRCITPAGDALLVRHPHPIPANHHAHG
jgi:hypothetical protein